MGLAEFRWWAAWWEVEPFGAFHDERRHAEQLAVAVNTTPGVKSPVEPSSMSPFLDDCQDYGTDHVSKADQLGVKFKAALHGLGFSLKRRKKSDGNCKSKSSA